MNGNQSLNGLGCLVYGWTTKYVSVKINVQKISAVQWVSKHNNMMNKRRRQPRTGQRKKKNTLTDSNYFYREINNVHEFSCMCNPVCMHITCTILNMHAVCEDLIKKQKEHELLQFWNQINFPNIFSVVLALWYLIDYALYITWCGVFFIYNKYIKICLAIFLCIS